MSYRVPRMWPGETVAVLATGPSMSQVVADKVRGLRCVAVNDAFRLAPWADMLYAADRRWWEANPDALDFNGIRLCAQPGVRGVEYMQHGGTQGFDPDPSRIRTGGNSGYQAVHVAIHAGAARVLLLGFDMHGTHFFGPHTKRTPDGIALRNTSPDSFARWAARFATLTGHGAEIINCTPGSAITAFPFSSIDEEVNRARVR